MLINYSDHEFDSQWLQISGLIFRPYYGAAQKAPWFRGPGAVAPLALPQGRACVDKQATTLFLAGGSSKLYAIGAVSSRTEIEQGLAAILRRRRKLQDVAKVFPKVAA